MAERDEVQDALEQAAARERAVEQERRELEQARRRLARPERRRAGRWVMVGLASLLGGMILYGVLVSLRDDEVVRHGPIDVGALIASELAQLPTGTAIERIDVADLDAAGLAHFELGGRVNVQFLQPDGACVRIEHSAAFGRFRAPRASCGQVACRAPRLTIREAARRVRNIDRAEPSKGSAPPDGNSVDRLHYERGTWRAGVASERDPGCEARP